MQGDLGFLNLIKGLFSKPKPPAMPPAAKPDAPVAPAQSNTSKGFAVSLPMIAAGALVVYLLAKKGK